MTKTIVSPAPTTVSSPRFVIDATPHGEGGFGRVLRGRDNALEGDVAVTVLGILATRFDPANQDRFRREARILASLSHPNIPAIYDVVTGADSFQIIFQCVAGRTLRQAIETDGPITLAQAQHW